MKTLTYVCFLKIRENLKKNMREQNGFCKVGSPLQGERRTGFRFWIRLGALAHFPSIGSDNTPSPHRCRKCEKGKFRKKAGDPGGPIGTLYNTFTTLQGPLNIQNRRVR